MVSHCTHPFKYAFKFFIPLAFPLVRWGLGNECLACISTAKGRLKQINGYGYVAEASQRSVAVRSTVFVRSIERRVTQQNKAEAEQSGTVSRTRTPDRAGLPNTRSVLPGSYGLQTVETTGYYGGETPSR